MNQRNESPHGVYKQIQPKQKYRIVNTDGCLKWNTTEIQSKDWKYQLGL